MATKSSMFSLRLDDDIAIAISSYAKRNSTTKAAALNHYARIGVDFETNPNNQPATRADLMAMREVLQHAITEQPIQVQNALPAPDEIEEEKRKAADDERRKISKMGFFERRRYLTE